MILTKEQQKTFEAASRPLIQWLNEEGLHPHVHVIVDNNSAELSESIAMIIVNDYLKD